jgi:dTDP-glucose 4,6-dehydratase
MKVLVTGGAGFIGSAICRLLIGEQNAAVLNVDKLTYAANLMSLRTIENNPRYTFRQADICDRQAMCGLMEDFDPDAVLHLAAESHVDRSIDGPLEFIRTNVEGTCVLLEATLAHWQWLPADRGARFRFHHVSNRRGFRVAWSCRRVHRNDAVRTELAIFGV